VWYNAHFSPTKIKEKIMVDEVRKEPDGATPLALGPTVIMAGHPRSGTSLCCQLVESGGTTFLCDTEADEYNREGYFEFSREKELSKRLVEQAMTEENTREMNVVVERLNVLPSPAGLKIVLIPALFFYRHIGRKNLRVVFTFRHPADCKASMLRRGISDFKLSWFENNNALIAAHENLPQSIVVSYESLMERNPKLSRAFEKIGLSVDLNRIKKIYRTQKNSSIVLTSEEERLYKKLKEFEKKSLK